ncbi:AEL170Cp [Eremothecium gossypii ATCC 10895]|uniref:AEL170Cp n=1 Tax=Eremothecium gossypii (strain ATCC 10895 / CBS 109.51 / FGSC 9923 / NRRL Y-1056) TaxID=284811 RepID=Q758C2_EREGS|nr:AEL170Cp [Eremothecium gossypii ATCC 10895]AAS52515.1 AEL170Cp [Eremothecium gossypii ATCC 10895]AEY96815.1 FAEL170Cp [Eremothecium gossypii FDAG1]
MNISEAGRLLGHSRLRHIPGRRYNSMGKIRGNNYFAETTRDVWTIINEAAAKAAAESVANGGSGAGKGMKVLNLGQGFFSYSPPDFAIAGAQRALENAMNNQYAPTRGRPALVEALLKLYRPMYGDLAAENVQVTTGANEGIFACLAGLVNPGDEVIVFEPFFDQYIPNIELLGGVVRYVPIRPPAELSKRVTEGTEWVIDYDMLRQTINEKTKAVIINSPHNPIGKVFTREELLKLGNICVEKGIYIISDEVYEHLYFTDEFTRIATLSEEISQHTLTVGSAGKSFAATGWRIGWVISRNKELLALASKAHVRICFSSPAPLQEACAVAIEHALKTTYYADTRAAYQKKYERFQKPFDDLGLPYTRAEGSYFLLVDFSRLPLPADYHFPEELADKGRDFRVAYWLINELGLVAIPCSSFFIPDHREASENMLRFAICKDDTYLDEAIERLMVLKNYL